MSTREGVQTTPYASRPASGGKDTTRALLGRQRITHGAALWH